MTDLEMVIEVMLPADLELKIPSASSINFDLYLKTNNLGDLKNNFLILVDNVCKEQFLMEFSDLTQKNKLEVIKACRSKDIQVFSKFVEHLLKAYYTNQDILLKIGALSTVSLKNSLPKDDWSILKAVYKRRKLYRE